MIPNNTSEEADQEVLLADAVLLIAEMHPLYRVPDGRGHGHTDADPRPLHIQHLQSRLAYQRHGPTQMFAQRANRALTLLELEDLVQACPRTRQEYKDKVVDGPGYRLSARPAVLAAWLRRADSLLGSQAPAIRPPGESLMVVKDLAAGLAPMIAERQMPTMDEQALLEALVESGLSPVGRPHHQITSRRTLLGITSEYFHNKLLTAEPHRPDTWFTHFETELVERYRGRTLRWIERYQDHGQRFERLCRGLATDLGHSPSPQHRDQ